MAKRKIGSIKWLPDGRSCQIRVQRGYRQDGSPRTLTRTLHDVSADEAEAEAVRMAAELGSSDLAGGAMTLGSYYWGVFRDTPSNRGRRRTRSTLRGYDYAMEHYVLPTLGGVRLDRITHDQIVSVVQAARSPRNCKTILRAVLLAAYDAGYLVEKPFQRRVPTPRPRAEQVQPWDRAEVAAALEAAEGWRPELRAYLALGLSGLRKSEALAVTPSDLAVARVYDFATGEERESMTVTVRHVFTEDDGLREGAKNDSSVRSVPVWVPCRAMLAGAARGCGPDDRIVGLSVGGFRRAWDKALDESGLRKVPPGTLRHTSDTIALDAGVAPDLVDKMHGRSEHTSTYRNYYRPNLSAMEEASRRTGGTIA